MPFIYDLNSAALATNFTTNGVANTETDHLFIKPGTRNVGLQAIYVGGKGAGLTALSGIAYRIKKWITAAATGGGSLTPAARDPGAQANKFTQGASASAGVTPGTGGPSFLGGCVSGAAGPGGWVSPNVDSLPTLEGSANQSIDIFTSSGTISLNFELNAEVVE